MIEKVCRCCNKKIGIAGWSSHILMHKKEFARFIGRVEWEAHNINWEDVVKFYNPKEADDKKCIGYPIPKIKRLDEYVPKV